ncbi:MAG: hypothetical protein ACI4HQ_03750 [Acetatifactor sp.]
MTKTKRDDRMNELFECEYVLDKKKYLSWGKENHARSTQRAFSVFWCVFATLTFIYAIYTKLYALVVFGIFALYRGLLRRKVITARQYSVLSKQRGTENWTRKILFCENNIVTEDGNVTVKNQYSEITGIEEKGNYIRLCLNNNTVIRLYSDCFVKGTWDECRKWLQEKGVDETCGR